MPDMYGRPRVFSARATAHKEGARAYRAGLQDINPYDRLTDSAQHRAWSAGYKAARNYDEAVNKVRGHE